MFLAKLPMIICEKARADGSAVILHMTGITKETEGKSHYSTVNGRLVGHDKAAKC